MSDTVSTQDKTGVFVLAVLLTLLKLFVGAFFIKFGLETLAFLHAFPVAPTYWDSWGITLGLVGVGWVVK